MKDSKTWMFVPHNDVAFKQVAGGIYNFDFIVTVESDKVKMETQFCHGLEPRK